MEIPIFHASGVVGMFFRTKYSSLEFLLYDDSRVLKVNGFEVAIDKYEFDKESFTIILPYPIAFKIKTGKWKSKIICENIFKPIQ